MREEKRRNSKSTSRTLTCINGVSLVAVCCSRGLDQGTRPHNFRHRATAPSEGSVLYGDRWTSTLCRTRSEAEVLFPLSFSGKQESTGEGRRSLSGGGGRMWKMPPLYMCDTHERTSTWFSEFPC
jgi:hypothetical protein